MLHQVLQPVFDPDFSESSYGFRPGRSAHDAVRKAQLFVKAGRRWVVDIDLEKFFERVNHDVLMSRAARKVKDKRVLRLIRRYLEAGIMEGGVVSPRTEGTPQGGPLSPLLSNILMKRGIDENRAWMSAANQRGAWWNSGASHMNEAFPKRFFNNLGLMSLIAQLHRIQCGS